MTPHGIMFHHFHGPGHPEQQGSISADDLRALLNYYGREHNIISADVWLDRALAGTLRDDDACLTFDDGLRCQYDIALPVLEALRLKAFWFVYTGDSRLELYRRFRHQCFPDVEVFYGVFFRVLWEMPDDYLAGYPFYTDGDRYFRYVRDVVLRDDAYDHVMQRMIVDADLSLDELSDNLYMGEAELMRLGERRHIVGLHSHTHPCNMAELEPMGQWHEYKLNRLEVVRLSGAMPITMSHPSGSYSPVTLDVLRGLGIKVGFRADMARVYGGALEYPREDHANIMARMRNEGYGIHEQSATACCST